MAGRKRIGIAMCVSACLLCGALLSACSSNAKAPQAREDQRQSSYSSQINGAAPNDMAPEYDMPAEVPSATGAADDASMAKDGALRSESGAIRDDVAKSQQAKRIYTGNMDMGSRSFDEDLARVNGVLTDVGGYIENQSLTGSPPSESRVGSRVSNMTLRVPSENFQAAMDALKGIGERNTFSTAMDDVSEAYYDSKARVEAYTLQKQRLEALIDKAETLSDVMALETEITRLTYEIESLNAQMRRWDGQVALSTIHLNLWEIETPVIAPLNPTLGQRISEGWVNSINGVRGFLEGFVVALAGFVPVLAMILVPLGAIVALVVWSVRKRRKKTAA